MELQFTFADLIFKATIQMNCPNIFVFICDGNDMNNYFLFKTLSIFLKDVVMNGKKLEDKKTEIVTVKKILMR